MEQNQAAPAELAASAERMTDVATRLCTLLAKMEQQFEALHAKVDRIVAAIDESPATVGMTAAEDGGDAQKTRSDQQASRTTMAQRLAESEKQNAELKAEAERSRRKTLSGTTLALLAKSGGEEGMPRAALEKALTSLSIEQRIAVKAEMARAGLL
jgi:phage terminase large subunit-like protein